MYFFINQKEIINPLSIIFDLESKINPLSTAATFKIEEIDNYYYLKLSGSDGELYYYKKIKVESKEECKFFLVTSNLYKFINSFPGEKIKIELKDNQVIASTKGYEITLSTVNSENVIMDKKNKISGYVEIKSSLFKEIINKIRVCVIEQKTRRNLGGINIRYFENSFYFIGSDSYRISIYNEKLEVRGMDINRVNSIIIPRKSMIEMEKILDDISDEKSVKIMFDNNSLVMESRNCYFKTALISDDYPDVSMFFSKQGEIKLKIKKEEINNALRIFKNTNNLNYGRVILELSKNQIHLKYSGENGVLLEKKLKAEYNQEEIKTQYNINYLYEAIQSFDDYSKEIIFEFNKPLDPVKIYDYNNEKHKHFLMPLR